jgi:CheY-like chemotaxis protein
MPRQARQPSILLVDDDVYMLELQTRMLHSMGYLQTTSVSSAKDALLQIEYDAQSADVIVCDLHMPDMDGIEFLQSLNASSFRGSVIFLSGEHLRIMHSVQKLLGGSQMTILGALSKPAGRNELRVLLDCWRPQPEPTARGRALSVAEDDLRIAHRDQQWVIHYQPQVDLKTGNLVGMEALVRWNHPEHGLVYPDQFITKAEDCGVIDDLTDWVVHAALLQHARWAAQGLMVQIGVNMSVESWVPRISGGVSPLSFVMPAQHRRIGCPISPWSLEVPAPGLFRSPTFAPSHWPDFAPPVTGGVFRLKRWDASYAFM